MGVRGSVVALALALLVAPTFAADEEVLAEVLVSRQLMEARGLARGDVIRLGTDPAGGDARRFRIAGEFEPTPDPFRLTAKRHEVRLHLPDLIDLVADPTDPRSREAVDRINLALDGARDVASFARELQAVYPGIVVTPTEQPSDANVFVVLERFHTAIAAVTVLGSTAFLLALMVIRADQRRETAGILRLIGFSRPRILVEVFVEGLVIATLGALLGVLLAVAVQGLFNAFFQWYYDTALVFVRITPQLALRCIAIALPLGVLAGLLASWTLLRRNVLGLLRR